MHYDDTNKSFDVIMIQVFHLSYNLAILQNPQKLKIVVHFKYCCKIYVRTM